VLARPRARSMIKIRLKNSLYSHRHFTEHLVGAFRKPPRKSNSCHEFLESFNPMTQEHNRLSPSSTLNKSGKTPKYIVAKMKNLRGNNSRAGKTSDQQRTAGNVGMLRTLQQLGTWDRAESEHGNQQSSTRSCAGAH
jgi:hypothetical protein